MNIAKRKLYFYMSGIISVMIVLSCCGQAQNNSKAIKKYHNKIDDINNAKQIKTLINSIDKHYSDFKINTTLRFSDKDCQKLCNSLKPEFYTKADFDNNGYTDLLVIGEWNDPAILCILDSGENRFSINRLTRRSFQDCTFPIIVKNENETSTLIKYYTFKEQDSRNDTSRVIESKTLIYKFGDFIEYNNSVKKYNIQKIEYKTTMCFGTCPVFALTINADRTARYNAERYNNPDGKFSGAIDERSYSELTGLLNYIDFPNLKDDYRVGWTDDQTCTLKITYDDGKIKTIRDYGLIGSYGLDRIYRMLFKLRETQTWK